MSETRIPTMNFRWRVPIYATPAEKSIRKVLQQGFYTSSGRSMEWLDVPEVPSAQYDDSDCAPGFTNYPGPS